MNGLQPPPDEEAGIRARFWHPQSGDVVIDVGSFEGTYALPALEAGAIVYAVDARADTLERLVQRAAHGQRGRLYPVHVALYDGGTYPDELIEQIRNSRYASSRDMVPDAPWSTLDELVGRYEIDRLDRLKIDVEGGELGVIQGGFQTLRELRPMILIEDHSRVYDWVAEEQTFEQILEILSSLDYVVELVREPIVDYIIAIPEE